MEINIEMPPLTAPAKLAVEQAKLTTIVVTIFLTTVHVNIGFVTAKQTRSFRGRSPDERKQERYEKLVSAGTREFGERGFHGTTVRDVCKSAQLTERYFYESFANLPELFTVVHDRANELLKTNMLQALAGAPREPIAMVEAAVRVYLDFLRADAQRARILLIESMTSGRAVLDEASQRRMVFVMLLRGYTQFLFPWLANPKLELSLQTVCNGLVGSTNYIATDWVAENFATPIERVLQSVLALYRGVILYARTLEPTEGAAATQPPRKRGRR